MLADRQLIRLLSGSFGGTDPVTTLSALSEDEAFRLRVALARIARGVDRRVGSGDGLTRTQLSVLGTVARARTMAVSELAEIEGLNPTMLSRVVGQLEQAGLVVRRPAEQDRRVVVVGITAAGARTQERLRRERARLFAERLAELSDERVAALSAALPALEALAATLVAPQAARRRSLPMTAAELGRQTFASLANRNFRRYFSGQAISLVGTWMQTVAQSWLVLQLSHSATALGMVVALQTLPVLLLGPTAGWSPTASTSAG